MAENCNHVETMTKFGGSIICTACRLVVGYVGQPPDAPRAPGIPTDPAELEAWKEEYTTDLLRHPGGVDAPWK
jgi:hypothetical protein